MGRYERGRRVWRRGGSGLVQRRYARVIDTSWGGVVELGGVLVDFGVVVEVVADDAVALAGFPEESVAIEDLDFAAVVEDDAVLLVDLGGEADGGSADAQHVAEELLGEGDGVGAEAVVGEEEPAGKALADAVFGVAAGGLGGLDELGLGEAEDEVVEGVEAAELAGGVVEGAGEAVSGSLHVDLVEAAAGAEEGGGAHDGLVAEEADLGLGAVFEGVGHRADAVFDEDEVADELAGGLDLFGHRQLHGEELQARAAAGI